MRDMTLQERIKKNEVYFRGMEIVNNTAIIKVLYGEKWGAYPSPDEKIKVAKSDEVPNEWFYYSDYTYTVIDEIFDLIEETIDMNLSAIERLGLFNQKMEELKELFANEPLPKLKTLTFHFEEEKSKRNNRKKKKNKEEIPTDEIKSEVVYEVENNEEINVEVV
jgi:1,2-phenylacetyl-CoA epoxidase catalytic subunit